MRVRHHIPSIFSLYMVDVFCCALGCVILLWLVKMYEADGLEQRAAAQSREADDKLIEYNARVGGLENEKKDLQKRLNGALAQAASSDEALAETRRRISGLTKDLEASGRRLDTEKARAAGLADKVAAGESRVKDLRAALKTVEDRATDLTRAMAKRDQDLTESGKQRESLLADKRALERDLEGRGKELLALREKEADATKRVRELEKEVQTGRLALAASGRDLEKVRGEKNLLRAEADRIRAAADNRFAGITLTGRRVVFLVDMSGSMGYLDDKTEAPTKWLEVRNTVAKVMRSLPDLEQYQVIVFARDAKFLLPGKGWLKYDPKASADGVVKSLAALKPTGGTDMYAALDAAFRLRVDELDTIYLLSDGLPNYGPGLTAEQERTLKRDSVERGELLGRYIRNKLKTEWNREVRDKWGRVVRPRVRINAVGFFYESPDVGAFLWALARENDGSFVGMSKP
jgi:hypothetical protein